jgi:two-component system NarL family sensor kinase
VTRFEIGGAVRVVVAHHTITQRKLAENALRAEQELLRRLIEVQENEKQFLCHEFHDGLIQYAIAARMMLEAYQSNRSVAEDTSSIKMVIENLGKGIEDSRRVIRGIRPAVLDDSDLEAAIDDLIDQFSTSGITVTSKCDSDIGRLPTSIQTTAYRVIQESLNNARKHSGADVVKIELKKVNDELHVEIRDYGCGFGVESARTRGLGLRGMTERVRLLGGEFTIESKQGTGTRVLVRLPISAVQE